MKSLKTIIIRFGLFLSVGSVIANTNAVLASPSDFKPGQIAVYASPEQLSDFTIEKHLPYSGISVLSVEPGEELGRAKQLAARGLKGGLNYLAKKSLMSSDSLSSYQWHFDKVQAQTAWTITDGTGTTVAVLDTGLRTGGNDGIACVLPGNDIVNSDSDPTDGDGHGTHVSGTIAQNTNNEIGVAGLAFGSCILPVKVLDDTGNGTFADIAEGIYYAVDNGAKVINMSLGSNAKLALKNDPLMDPALDYAYNNGVTIVAASGNDSHRRNVAYPAIYPTTIAVGSTDFNNRVVRYSNKGQGLDLVAPGGDTGKDSNNDGYADGVLQETYVDGEWGYWFYQGTSMAAPHVSGIAAMLISANVASTPDDIKAALTSTTLDIGDGGFDSASAHGLVQAYAALNWTPGSSGSEDEEPPAEECTDADGDGFCEEEGDCDDSNSQVNPNMNEKGKRRNDGLDNDCNGTVDG